MCFKLGMAEGTPQSVAVGNLCLIAFYYLLRVGEYTKPRWTTHNGRQVRATRTKQFTVGNVGFFCNNEIIPRTSSRETLIKCDSATLKITNQKNGRMGDVIHQEAVKDAEFNFMTALGNQVATILENGGTNDTLLCTYYVDGEEHCVQRKDIVRAVRQAAKALHLERCAIDPDLVGSHSLRAGGAMALKLHGYSDTTIQKFGRWTSNTFMMYVHTQIAHLSKGVSKSMSTPLPFTNIAAIEAY